MRGSILTAVLSASLLATGCGACTEKLAEKALEQAGVKVEGDTVTLRGKDGEEIRISGNEGTVVVKGKDGEEAVFAEQGGTVRIKSAEGEFEMATQGQAKIPDGFPLAVADGVDVASAASSKSDRERSYFVTLQSAKGVDDLASFYERELKDKGLKVERNEMQFDNVRMVSFRGEKDQTEATVIVRSEGDEGKTAVQLSWRELTAE